MRLLLKLDLLRLKGALRNLFRSPGRAALSLLIALGFAFALLGAWLGSKSPGSRHGVDPQHVVSFVEQYQSHVWAVAFGLVLLITYQQLYEGLRGGVLVFGASDIDFLFASPIPRRTVLLYKLCLDYAKVAAYLLFVTVWVGPHLRSLTGSLPRAPFLYALGAFFSYLVFVRNLSGLVSVLRTFHAAVRRWLPVALTGAVLAAVALAVLPPLAAGRAGDILHGVSETLQSASLRVALFPVIITTQALTAPLLGMPTAALAKLGALVGLAAASLALLLSRTENLYEPGLELSRRRNELRAAARRGDMQAVRAVQLSRRATRRRAHSTLEPFGRGMGVLLWKPLAVALRSPVRAVAGALLTTVLPLWALRHFAVGTALQGLVRYLPLMVIYVLWVLSLSTMQWQRGHLRQVNTLKPLPLPAWQVALASVLPLTVGLAAWLVVVLGGLMLFVPGADPRLCLLTMFGAPPLMLVLNLTTLCVVTQFPSSQDPAQNTLAVLVLMVGLPLVMLPAVGSAVALWVVQAPNLLLALGTALSSLCVSVPLTLLAAHLYRRFDPTE